MRKLKSIFSVLLAVCLLLTTCTVAFAAETETAATKYNVTVRANNVATNIDASVIYGDYETEVSAGGTLGSYITVSHAAEHNQYFIGWHVIQDNGSGFEPVLDSNGAAVLLTTADMMLYPINQTTMFEALWTGKYTSMAWMTVNGNGGIFDLTYTDDGGAHTQSFDATSFQTETVGDSLSSVGVTSVTDPVNGNKTFEGWVAYYHGPTENEFSDPVDGKLLTSAEVLTYGNKGIGYTDFIAKWQGEDIVFGSTEGPNDGVEAPAMTSYIVEIDANGFDYWTDITHADGYTEIAPCGGSSSFTLDEGSTLAQNLIRVWHEEPHLSHFLGWMVYVNTAAADQEPVWTQLLDSDNNPIIIPTEEMVDHYVIDRDLRFVAQWPDDYGTFEPGDSSTSLLNIDANGGTFDITCQATALFQSANDTGYIGVLVPAGTTLKDIGVIEISDIKFWDGKREFLGWNVLKSDIIFDGNGNYHYGSDSVLLTEEPITTAEILVYPTEENSELLFEAVWAGDDSDYYTCISFYGVGGEFKYDSTISYPDNPYETTDFLYFDCKATDETIAEQFNAMIVSDPVREGYTFEGWLPVPDALGQRYKISDKLYTSEEVFTELTIPEQDTSYLAKWKEIPFDEYRYGYPERDYGVAVDWNFLSLFGEGGTFTWDCEMFSEPEVFESLYLDAYKDQTFFERLEEVGTKSLTFEKDKSTLTGWTVYTADDYYDIYVPANETFTTNDYTALYFDMFEYDNDLLLAEYKLLKNAKVYAENMSTEDVLNLKGAYYYAVANWSDWIEVKVEGSEEKYMLEVSTIDLTVPKAAADKYETVEEAKTALKDAAFTVSTVNKEKAETVYYEITLKVQKDDGTWEVVTPENFPKEGVKIVIPYNGLDPKELDFVVTHLVSAGDNAGEIEVLKHTEGETGLEATVYSLSPFAVTYQKTEDTVVTPDKNPNDVPPTGDTNTLFFFLAVMATAAMALIITVKKLRKA